MIEFMKLDPQARIPQVQREGDAGFDLCLLDAAHISGKPALYRTGVAVAIPEGYVGLVVSRSGCALKQGVVVTNAPGIIDSNYRGELGLILHSVDPEAVSYFPAGARVAQLVVVPVSAIATEVSFLGETNRGSAGFGSSGT